MDLKNLKPVFIVLDRGLCEHLTLVRERNATFRLQCPNERKPRACLLSLSDTDEKEMKDGGDKEEKR